MAKSANQAAAVKAPINLLAHAVDGEHLATLDYQDHRQKCPLAISKLALDLDVEGIGYKLFHHTDQEVEYVDVVEAYVYVDELEAAFDMLSSTYKERADIHVAMPEKGVVTVVGDGRNFKLVQWTESSDITLDNVILCTSMED